MSVHLAVEQLADLPEVHGHDLDRRDLHPLVRVDVEMGR